MASGVDLAGRAAPPNGSILHGEIPNLKARFSVWMCPRFCNLRPKNSALNSMAWQASNVHLKNSKIVSWQDLLEACAESDALPACPCWNGVVLVAKESATTGELLRRVAL